MEKTAAGWTIIDEAAGVLSLSYEFSKNATSNCFAARMSNGQMMVISPSIGLSDAAANELLAFGEVGALVANNGFHYLGQRDWQRRFPKARAFASAEAAKRIKGKQADLPAFEPLSALQALAGASISMRDVPNTKCGESWCWVKTEAGYVWYVSDVLINLPMLPPAFVPRTLFKLTKSAPGYRVFHLALQFTVKDKRATLRDLLSDIKDHAPSVIVPGHGNILMTQTVSSDTEQIIEAVL